VLDAGMKSKRWHQRLPESAKALPLPEPALVFGVSDRDQLRKALHEYRGILNDLLAKGHDLAPQRVPALTVPAAKIVKETDGTLFCYPLPERWGFDRRIVPNVGLGDKVAVLTFTKEQSEQLLAHKPLSVKRGPLAEHSRPLAAATYVNIAGLVDLAAPWVDYAARQFGPHLKGHEVSQTEGKTEATGKLEPILPQVHTVLQVLKVFRSYASITYRQDGVWVTHSETVIRDLPEPKK
jgi:hypothetical protein